MWLISPNFLTSLTDGLIKLTLVIGIYPTPVALAGILKLWAFYLVLPQLVLAWIAVIENGEKKLSPLKDTEAHSCSTRETSSFPVGTQYCQFI